MIMLGWTGPNVPSPPDGMEPPRERAPQPRRVPSSLLEWLLGLVAIVLLIALGLFMRHRESARQDAIDQSINLGSEAERAEVRALVTRNRAAIERLQQEKPGFFPLVAIEEWKRAVDLAALRVTDNDAGVWDGTRIISDQAGVRRRISPEGLTDIPSTLNEMRKLNRVLNNLLGER